MRHATLAIAAALAAIGVVASNSCSQRGLYNG